MFLTQCLTDSVFFPADKDVELNVTWAVFGMDSVRARKNSDGHPFLDLTDIVEQASGSFQLTLLIFACGFNPLIAGVAYIRVFIFY